MSIKFNSIDIQDKLNNLEIDDEKNITIFYGKKIDERSDAIHDYFQKNGSIRNSYEIYYIQNDDSFYINNLPIKKNKFNEIELNKLINTSFKIILDSTTLSYIEIITILFYLNKLKKNFKVDIYYVEPLEYTNEKVGFHEQQFHLSYDSGNLSYIKPFYLDEPLDNINKDKAAIITFIGFEDDRLATVLDIDDFNKIYQDVFPIISIPGFQYGWENISLTNHIDLLGKMKLYYSPADNPYASYQLLKRLINDIGYNQIVLMPFGTKPNTVASAIFMINYKESYDLDKNQPILATQFDFPVKKPKRTKGIKEVHQYKLTIN
ncbi:hypothetical protein [Halarcobacter ebronensis]|uniref:Uncharacterized protein n=1 Tax=Halarcobacter ebronensis TaxID=1462615 RepID=A0A4Q1AQY9_9BACT|nr:hypothetical protein [Halarcobacter ebronensis]QKF83388.1 hypothetical protein AEBR_2937 [Halarcobacter ebronensis]RXK05948.1 hypothetical protein CRV07_07705 [Halarcobacter ebronensis]